MSIPSPKTETDYSNVIDDAYSQGIKWVHRKDWKKVTEKDDILLEELEVEGSDFLAYRTTALLRNVNIDDITRLVYNAGYQEKKRVAEDLISQKTIKRVTSHCAYVCLARYSTPSFVVSDREFLAVKSLHKFDSGARLVTVKSIDLDDVPPDDDYVRGTSDCAIMLLPMEEDPGIGSVPTVKIVNVNHIDPKGYVPAFLINMFKERSLQMIENIRKVYTTK